MAHFQQNIQTFKEKGRKIEKTVVDYHEGKLSKEEFEATIKETFQSIMEEPFIQQLLNMDAENAILFGNLMNRKHEREGKPLTFSGPEQPYPIL